MKTVKDKAGCLAHRMKGKLVVTVAVLLAALNTNAQTNYLTVGEKIRLPQDSTECSRLVAALNDFLFVVQRGDGENPWILSAEKAETELLTDEIRDTGRNDSIAFKPYLINVESLADKKGYLLQVSYMGINRDVPMLGGVFELIAHQTEAGYLFSSPLKKRTSNWQTKTVDYLTFYYQDTSAVGFIDQWSKWVLEYNKKFNSAKPVDVYLCESCNDMTCMLHLMGIGYKRGFNGLDWSMMDFTVKEKGIALYTQRRSRQQIIDPHDIFHWCANNVIPSDKRNHYMVCGSAYVYGGSWGISWEEIQVMFKTRMSYDKKTDWLKLYFERYNFGESRERHLLVTQFINALIIQKVEKERGFASVMELLSSGNMYRNEATFFEILEKVTGINKGNFNKEVGKLVRELKK